MPMLMGEILQGPFLDEESQAMVAKGRGISFL